MTSGMKSYRLAYDYVQGNALDTASQPGGRVTINPSGTTLTISVVESSDAGVYECVVESPGGTRTASARLTVSAQG
jgi:Immunoglobulin I-set domain